MTRHTRIPIRPLNHDLFKESVRLSQLNEYAKPNFSELFIACLTGWPLNEKKQYG